MADSDVATNTSSDEHPWEVLLRRVNNKVQDNVLFCVCRIVSDKTGTIGTGFFYSPSGKDVFFVTALHVIDMYPDDSLSFIVRIKGSGFETIEIPRQELVKPNRDVDLVGLNVTGIFSERHASLGCKSIPRTWIESDENLLNEFSVVTPVCMYGYPTGLFDPATEFPLVRTGHTASHPGLQYNHRNEGRMNIANYAADSGAPVFIVHEEWSQHPNLKVSRGYVAIFIGIHHEGFTSHTSYGLNDPPADADPEEQLNLGSFIKSSELFDILRWGSMHG